MTLVLSEASRVPGFSSGCSSDVELPGRAAT